MAQQKKWAMMTFHVAMIIILLGAGVTRYFGFEGVMHIREGESSNEFLSSETYLKLKISSNGQLYEINEPVLFASLGNNNWEESYQIGNDIIEAKVDGFIPNPVQLIRESSNGKPIIKIVLGGDGGREEYFLTEGETKRIRNVIFNFGANETSDAINIALKDDELYIKSSKALTQMVMATQKRDTLIPRQEYYPLRLKSLYSDGSISFVFGDFKKKGEVYVQSEYPKVKRESLTALKIKIAVNGDAKELFVYGQKGLPGRYNHTVIGGLNIGIAYGSKTRSLPFSIKLHEFIMERYPGTENAASYASEVQLLDGREGLKEDFRIYMNHILDHDGYRFFQSSFDRDEKGTYLSVNHDWWGTWISYLGYFLLTFGMVLSLFSKKSRFYQLGQKIKAMRKESASTLLILFMLFLSLSVKAQKKLEPINVKKYVSIDHAEKFSRLIVQDHRGRMKPMHTMSREIMRKVARKESINDLSADQAILSMFVNNKDWYNVPLIKLGNHRAIKEKLGVVDTRVAYSNFFTKNGKYLFQDEVRKAYSLEPVDRGVYEKELLKIDERVNIVNMVFSGRIFKLIPVVDDENNTWLASGHSGRHNHSASENVLAERFFTTYKSSLQESMNSGNYDVPNQILDELSNFQNLNGGHIVPSSSKISLEILLNKLNVFNRLAGYYTIMGLLFLFFLFFSVFKPNFNLAMVYKVLFGLLLLGFAYHTLGLALRWHVSGRAPWSNGYESMIYIAWTTTLAGVLFARKSFGGLAATMILAATVLLVALLNYMDPEITPLVPVLKSYWLTIHVSLEAGSYGFLMLGAVIGIINLILFIFLMDNNKDTIERIVKEMTYLSEMTLIGGMIMISTGTYLGGIWANESWGRYWGWDAKETWALVTILVYAFILHMRLIPKLYSLYAYNLASVFGLASVIMTYYGVNYYLSGLHSYAAGDPLPIPSWVYIVVVIIVILSLLAYWKKRKYKLIQ